MGVTVTSHGCTLTTDSYDRSCLGSFRVLEVVYRYDCMYDVIKRVSGSALPVREYWRVKERGYVGRS